MMHKTSSLALVGVMAVFLAGFFCPERTLAIGQVVKPIVHKDVLRGQAVSDTLTLINSEPQAVVFELNADGDIKDWVKFYTKDNSKDPVTKIQIPKSSHLDAIAEFTVPKDIKNGTYTGAINLVSSPGTGSSSGQSATVRQMVSRPVSITVSDKEIVDVEAYILPVSYTVAPGQPLQVVVKYDNRGNIAVKPQTQLTVYHGNAQLFDAIFPYPENEPEIKPLAMKTMPAILWSTAGQQNGDYDARVKIILNGQTVKESEFSFTIGGLPGILAANLFAGFGGNWELLWLGMAVLVLAVVLLFKTLRARRAKLL